MAGLRIGYLELVDGVLRMLDGLGPAQQRGDVRQRLRFYRIDMDLPDTSIKPLNP